MLADLDVTVVEAESGREALRCLLRQPFAVILLDVNMPGLDGFETAALIRQRPSSEHTPIIFVTAYEDDAHAMRGYSLGAVDYILSPVQPNILRTKVSVFIDLYRKAEEIRAQREALERYATQLRQLSDASLAIHSASDFDDVLAVVADNAARIIGARQASVSALTPHSGRVTTVVVVAPANGPRTTRIVRNSSVDLPALGINRPMRLLHPGTNGDGAGPADLIDGRPLHGWLAAPLTARDGRRSASSSSPRSPTATSPPRTRICCAVRADGVDALENTVAAEAREANRLKDEFLGVLSHELRTPLQAILTWMDILRQQPADAGPARAGAEVIERSAQSQTRLIADLLDVSRIVRGQLRLERQNVELTAVVRLALETVQAMAASKRIVLSFVPPGDDCRVAATRRGCSRSCGTCSRTRSSSRPRAAASRWR